MTDVLLINEPDGGNIVLRPGVPIEMSDGLRTAVYNSLFGGNSHDSGSTADARKQWWANFAEQVPARRLRSETAYLLRAIPATTGNMRLIEAAAERDLAWMLEDFATLVSAEATIPAVKRVKLDINIEIDGRVYTFSFTEAWEVAA